MNKTYPLFVCAFLGDLFLKISWAIPVPESHGFSAFYFSILFFFPWMTQKPKSSLLHFFQLPSKYQALCLKELLQGDHLIKQELAEIYIHHFCSPSLVCWLLSSSQKLPHKFHSNRRELFKASEETYTNVLVLIFSVCCLCEIYS